VTNHPHQDVDLAAIPLGPVLNQLAQTGERVFYRAIPTSLIATSPQLEELSPIEEVVFVGYPNNVHDSVNHLPVARRGTTATPPSVDFCGRPCFLLDGSVFPGSSGSPVFVANEGAFVTRAGMNIGANRILLLGVIASVVVREVNGELDFVTVPTRIKPVVTTEECVDLGLVFKGHLIIETIEAILRVCGESV